MPLQWRFAFDPLTEDSRLHAAAEAPRGSAVHICSLFGVPPVRLRLALPDDWFSTPLAAAVGTRCALSKAAMEAPPPPPPPPLPSSCDLDFDPHGDASFAPSAFSYANALGRSPRIARTALTAVVEGEWAPSPEEQAEEDARVVRDELLGTAVVASLLLRSRLISASALAPSFAAWDEHFAGVSTPAGRTFSQAAALLSGCVDALATSRPGWLASAAVARLALCQRPDGCFEPSQSVASCLRARPWAEVLQCSADGVAAAAGAPPRPPPPPRRRSPPARRAKPGASLRGTSPPAVAISSPPRGRPFGDDPLCGCSVTSLLEMCPPDLAFLPPDDSPSAVWSTLCVIALLEQADACVASVGGSACGGGGGGGGGAAGSAHRTMVDDAVSWLDRHAASPARPQLAAALRGGHCASAARGAVRLWAAAWGARCGELKRCSAVDAARPSRDARAAALLRSLRQHHPLVSPLTASPAAAGISRSQRVARLATLALVIFAVQIWLFYSRSAACCATVRAILDGGPPSSAGSCPPAGPCRGFTGDCADLATQFSSLPVPPNYPFGLSSFECDAFPNISPSAPLLLNTFPRDLLLVALITLACTLPAFDALTAAFEAANAAAAASGAPPRPRVWLTWRRWQQLLAGAAAHRKWRFAAVPPPSRFAVWLSRRPRAPTYTASLASAAVGGWLAAACLLERLRRGAGAGASQSPRAPPSPAGPSRPPAPAAAPQPTGFLATRRRPAPRLTLPALPHGVPEPSCMGFASPGWCASSGTAPSLADSPSPSPRLSLSDWVTPRLPPAPRGAAAPPAAKPAALGALRSGVASRLGAILVASVWGTLFWVSLSYGELIYRLLGASTVRSLRCCLRSARSAATPVSTPVAHQCFFFSTGTHVRPVVWRLHRPGRRRAGARRAPRPLPPPRIGSRRGPLHVVSQQRRVAGGVRGERQPAGAARGGGGAAGGHRDRARAL